MREARAVGVIPDGNRRFARKMGIPLREGYLRGVETVERFVNYVRENTSTSYIYLYTLSLENLRKRSRSELDFLFSIFKKQAQKLLERNIYDARIRFIGRRSELPKSIQKMMDAVERKTENAGELTVVLAIGYTGLAEVVDMVRNVAERVARGDLKPEEITEETVLENLYTADMPSPDFILRTSGEMRTSGFLPIQSVYSELIFYPKYWPELDESDFRAIYDEYMRRERRFGK